MSPLDRQDEKTGQDRVLHFNEWLKQEWGRLRILVHQRLRKSDPLRAVLDSSDLMSETLLRLRRRVLGYQPKSLCPTFGRFHKFRQARPSLPPMLPEDFWKVANRQISLAQIDLARKFRAERRAPKNTVHATGDQSNGGLLSQMPSKEKSPSTDAKKDELKTAILKAAEQLPDKERSVFLLKFIEQISNEEIAQRLQVTDKTVRNRWNSVCKKLRTILNASRIDMG